ncbi:MAG: primosomal protein N' [Syntrophaceae bacterium]|nr:primosomal protein N' [Syntrophaceae bacterium]
MPASRQYIEVALPLPVRKTFTYEVPAELGEPPCRGKRVLVPLGRRFLTGFVLGPALTLPTHAAILPVREILDDDLSLSPRLLGFLLWTSSYYLQPVGAVLKNSLPAGTLTRSKETLFLTEKGTAIMDVLEPDSMERRVLAELAKKGKEGISSALLRRKFSAPIRGLLSRMGEKGWVGKAEDLETPAVREKKVPWVRLRPFHGEVPLTGRQREVVAFLQTAPEIPVAELKARFKNASAVLAKLKAHGLVEIVSQGAFRQPSGEGLEDWIDGPPSLLTDDQKGALREIVAALDRGKYQAFLLHGVTGSGKTEVYLRAIEETLSRGRQALLLVPEISLTGQLVAYFRSRTAHPLALLHSGLSAGERYDEWRKVKKGLAKLVIGARSAIFAPLESPGIIIVDEEHDPSYKQEGKVRYHARDLALVRGKMEDAVVVLGSATPSLESYHNSRQGKFRLLSLPNRIDSRPLPEIRVLDMRSEQGEGRERPLFSRPLREALQETVARGEQAFLFLNRRGFSTFALCRDCGFTYRCPNCSVSLIYHLPDRTFRCHYCDHTLYAADRCPQCASSGLFLFGSGTQRLEGEIKKMLPQVPVIRMDRDTTTRKGSHQKILGQLRRGEVNLLVGTQMITKGHDLPRVTLVGVLAADLSLNLPDFRAAERTFQLLTQVAGRAGRGHLPGKVFIQSYNPTHYSIQMARGQDYAAFFEQELELRRQMNYPPFVRLINLRFEDNSEKRIARFAQALEELVQRKFLEDPKLARHLEVLGPVRSPLGKLKGRHRYQMLFKGKSWNSLHTFVEKLLTQIETEMPGRGVKLIVDVDPVHML